MFSLILVCILLFEKPIFLKPIRITTPTKALRFMFLMWLYYEENERQLWFVKIYWKLRENSYLWEHEKKFLNEIVMSLLHLFILEIDCFYILLHLELEVP